MSICDMVYQFWKPIDQIAICYLADKQYDTSYHILMHQSECYKECPYQ
jgi:hypothetical protein